MKPFTKIVVVAAIVRRGASTLLARRREGSLAGYWEFPGGKIEAYEQPEEALQRELFEELSVECQVGKFFGESEHATPQGNIKLLFYDCELLAEPVPGVAHDAVEWVTADTWETFRVSPADVPILKKLYSGS